MFVQEMLESNSIKFDPNFNSGLSNNYVSSVTGVVEKWEVLLAGTWTIKIQFAGATAEE